ncbi:rubredoxin-like domain-containing protein [Salidesulfovibrio onnuriiensis]|uniref:rubredoxin-like domain-containing protein n=1 Tax=Salidesulfovibrio onnuriiensis TaxID=2583823 RepID=UPI0011C9018A|nr:rubrerythrin family protein [Salidesulfovibrio onnuriiensis]
MNDNEVILAVAFSRESRNAARNAMAALKADKDGHPRAARLLRAVAAGQEVHAGKLLMLLRGKLGDTGENLAVAREKLEDILADYPDMLARLQEARDRAGESMLSQFLKTAVGHKGRLARFDEDRDAHYQVCGVCGFLAEGEAPERCPVCHAVQGRFFSPG